jgi:hypothetical protein
MDFPGLVLAGLLGEIRRTDGTVTLCGSVGYCSQQAWIQNASLRDNILFGLPFDAARYIPFCFVLCCLCFCFLMLVV